MGGWPHWIPWDQMPTHPYSEGNPRGRIMERADTGGADAEGADAEGADAGGADAGGGPEGRETRWRATRQIHARE